MFVCNINHCPNIKRRGHYRYYEHETQSACRESVELYSTPQYSQFSTYYSDHLSSSCYIRMSCFHRAIVIKQEIYCLNIGRCPVLGHRLSWQRVSSRQM